MNRTVRIGRIGRKALAFTLAAISLLALGLPATTVAQDDSVAVDTLVDRVIEGMGGAEAWDKARFFSFDFVGRRSHWWDRYDGRHRMEGTNREGQSYVVLHNINSRGEGEGTVLIDGKPADAAKTAEMLKGAYGAWINDTYWLVMPFKLRDPGVKRSNPGPETIDGVTYERIEVQFESVGLTPGDTYWLYLDPETGRPFQWSYVLQNQEPPATVWHWTEWQEYGPGIWLSGLRTQPGSDRELSLGNIAVPDTLPDSVFTSTEPMRPASEQ